MLDPIGSSGQPARGLNRLVGWSQHPGILLAMMGQTFINMLGAGIVGPILPLYARSFGVSAAAVGLLMSAFGIARIPINVPAGGLAEKYGRKPLLVIGPLIMGVASLLTGFSTSYEQVLALRLLQGVGSALQMTAGMIVMADISTAQDRGRTMSLYQGSLLLGTSTGPMIGGFAGEHLGLQAPFLIYAALTLLAAAWAYFAVSETRHLSPVQPVTAATRRAMTKGKSWRAGLQLLRNRDFVLVSLVTLAIFFTRTGSQNTVLPLLGSARFDIGPQKLGYAFTLIALVNLLTINAAGQICDRFGRKTAIVPSCLVCGIALASFTVGHTYTHFLLSCAFLGVGTGIGGPAPAAYVSDLELPGGRGLAMGIYRTVGDLGISIAPVLLGWISDQFSFSSALWTNGLLFVVVGVAFALWARETRPGGGLRPRDGLGQSWRKYP